MVVGLVWFGRSLPPGNLTPSLRSGGELPGSQWVGSTDRDKARSLAAQCFSRVSTTARAGGRVAPQLR